MADRLVACGRCGVVVRYYGQSECPACNHDGPFGEGGGKWYDKMGDVDG